MTNTNRESDTPIKAREPGTKISVGRLMIRSVARAGQYPIATCIGVILTYLSTRVVSLLPATSAVDWYLRLGFGFSIGMFLVGFLVALGALRGVERPTLFTHLGRAAIGSTVIGFVVAVPVVGVALLVPEWFWEPATSTWVYWWVDTFIVSCGGLWIAAISPDLLIAWPLSIKSKLPLQKSLLFTWMSFEDGHLSPFRLAASISSLGAILAFVPLISLVVVSLLFHTSMVLFESLVEER